MQASLRGTKDETVRKLEMQSHGEANDEHLTPFSKGRRALLGSMAAFWAGLTGAAIAPEDLLALPATAAPTELNNAEICNHYGVGDPAAFVLSKKMNSAWVSFARTGNSNHSGLPHWPAYAADTRSTMYFGAPCVVRNDPEGNGLRVIVKS
jgi:hypothetical protein